MSAYVVSAASVVHRTTCPHARRMTYSYPWNPSSPMSFDKPCSRCLGYRLPTTPTTTDDEQGARDE